MVYLMGRHMCRLEFISRVVTDVPPKSDRKSNLPSVGQLLALQSSRDCIQIHIVLMCIVACSHQAPLPGIQKHTSQLRGLQHEQVLKCQQLHPLQPTVARAGIHAKRKPVPHRKVNGLSDVEAVSKPSMVRSRKGDDEIARLLNCPEHRHPCEENTVSKLRCPPKPPQGHAGFYMTGGSDSSSRSPFQQQRDLHNKRKTVIALPLSCNMLLQ